MGLNGHRGRAGVCPCAGWHRVGQWAARGIKGSLGGYAAGRRTLSTASGVARWAGAGRRPRWPCSSQPRRGVTCGCWGAMGAISKPYGGSWAALIAGSGCMSVEMAVG